MNEPDRDHLCSCFGKSLWVYTLLCALSDPPAYVPSSYPASTLRTVVHDSRQPLVPAGLTSAATHATLLPPERIKYSPFQSKRSGLMPLDPHLGYKSFFPGWLCSKISVWQLKCCATRWDTERQAQARTDAAVPSCTWVMIHSAFQRMKHQLSISFPSSSTLITAETLPEIHYGAIKGADYLFRINEMWFNGACVGLQASKQVLVFWASV